MAPEVLPFAAADGDVDAALLPRFQPRDVDYCTVSTTPTGGRGDNGGDGASGGARRRCDLLLRAALALLSVGVLLVLLAQLPLKLYVLALAAWVKKRPLAGSVAVSVLFCAAVPLWVPSTALEMAAGSLFGVAQGLVVITVGKTGGSLLAFLAARRLGRAAVGGFLTDRFTAFRALCTVLGGASWKPLLLFQLSSVPNMVKCYALALTDVSAARFAVSSALGGLPHAVLWAHIGAQASDLAAVVTGRNELSAARLGLLAAGGAVTFGAMAALVVYTRRQLQELQKRERDSGSEEESFLLGPATDNLLAATSSSRESSGLALHSEVAELTKTRTGSMHHHHA